MEALVDFDLELKEMMHEYNIDTNRPRFYQFVQAEKLIKSFWTAHSDIREVIVLYETQGDYEHFRLYIPTHMQCKKIKYSNNTFFSYQKSANEIKECNADIVLLITYQDHNRIKAEFANLGIEVFDLYEYFIENGLNIFHEFYKVTEETYFDATGNATNNSFFENYYGILFYDKRGYELAKTEKLKVYYLQNIIFDYYYIGNFSDGKEYIQKYIKLYPKLSKNYLKFLEKVEILLEKIHRKINNKKQKDIVMYWVDAFSYGEDRKLPFLSSLDEECMVCKNAFAVVDTTRCEASALFRKEMPLEAKYFREGTVISKSVIFDDLESCGWEFKYYGIGRMFSDKKVKTIEKHSLVTVSTIHHWKMLCDMAKDIKPVFRLVHLMGGHTAYLSPDINENVYIPIGEKPGTGVMKQVYEQRKLALQYEDRQLAFYDSLIDTRATIYFSDHGCPSYALNNLAVLHHIMFKVKSELVEKGSYERIFTPIYFEKLVKHLLMPERYPISDMFQEYGLICTLPRYSKQDVKGAYISQKYFDIITHLGYRGIVRGGYVYFLCNCGIELCYEIRDEKAYLMGYNRSREIREDCRKILGENPLDIEGDEKFKYSRLLFKVYERASARMNLQEQRKRGTEFCKKLIDTIPAENKLAIRGGGDDTVMFLDCLDERQRNRISYIIDGNIECAANNWGIPVILPSEMKKLRNTTVLVISSNHHINMIEELKCFKELQTIDIYEEMWKNGFERGTFLSHILCGGSVVFTEEDFQPVDWDEM